MKKAIIALFFVSMLIFTAAPCFAGPITVGDPLWYEFGFGLAGTDAYAGTFTIPSSGGNSQPADDPAWTFTAPFGTRLTVVDAFTAGDIFTVYDFGYAIGSTSFIANTGISTGISDPALAILNNELSRGFFSLLPGSHSITITVAQNALNTSGGAGFFRVDEVPCSPVPIPAAVWLLGSGLVGLVGLRRKFRK